jgi:hypothetical protein
LLGLTFASAEAYNVSANAFESTARMTVARLGQSATLLPNGQVLIAGGETGNSGVDTFLSSAELFTP